MSKSKAVAFVEVREGRKLIMAKNAYVDQIQSLMLDVMSTQRVMVNFALLLEGNSFTFKHKARSITVKPLVNHVQNY